MSEGGELIQPRIARPAKGYWFPPSVITGVTASHRVAQEEIFGPVLSVMTFRTPEEAIERANNTPYGLSAGVWTDKGSKIFKMIAQAARRCGLGEYVQQVRSDEPVWWIQGKRIWARGRRARAAAVCEVRAVTFILISDF